MTPTTLRPAGHGRRAQAQDNTPRLRRSRFGAAKQHGGLRGWHARLRGLYAPTRHVRAPYGAGPMWSLLLPSFCTNNPTEEAMPDPDAGPRHRPHARILGGSS